MISVDSNPQLKSVRHSRRYLRKSKISLSTKNNLIHFPSSQGPIVDPFPYYHIDKPLTPIEVRDKITQESGTQIAQGDWLLLDFEREVIPITQIMVARVLDGAKCELVREFELAEVEKKRQKKELLRKAKLFKLQQIEDSRKRFQEEIERRNYQIQLLEERNRTTMRKLLSRNLVKSFLFCRNDQELTEGLDRRGLLVPQMISEMHGIAHSLVLQTVEVLKHKQALLDFPISLLRREEENLV